MCKNVFVTFRFWASLDKTPKRLTKIFSWKYLVNKLIASSEAFLQHLSQTLLTL